MWEYSIVLSTDIIRGVSGKYLNMFIYTYIDGKKYIHIYKHTHIHTYIHTSKHTLTNTHNHTHYTSHHRYSTLDQLLAGVYVYVLCLISNLNGYCSILLVSYFTWSGASESLILLLSYPITSLSSPITIILISAPKHPSMCRQSAPHHRVKSHSAPAEGKSKISPKLDKWLYLYTGNILFHVEW